MFGFSDLSVSTVERESLGERLGRFKGIGPGFDFLRIALALSIVAFHTFILTGNDWILRGPLWMVEYALVPMFFALSGFLVSASAERLSLANFLINRGLRIVPALAVDVAVAALLIGPAVTALTVREYFSDGAFSSYFWNMIGFIHYDLPGVFKSSFYTTLGSTKVNGSLWTVPYEIICYFILSLFMVGKFLRHRRRVLYIIPSILLAGVVVHQIHLVGHLSPIPAKIIDDMFVRRQAQVVTAFLFGVTAYLYKERIVYSFKLFLASLMILLAAALLLDHSQVEVPEWRFLLLPAIVYVTLFLGLTRLRVPAYFRTGDYSYGIYLYHGPFIQVIIGLFPAIAAVKTYGACFVFTLTLPCILTVAHLSWHFVEKPVLVMRKKFSFVARERGISPATTLRLPILAAQREREA